MAFSIFVRARDVRSSITELGFEAGVIRVLERICEENAGHRQALVQMTELLNQCIGQFDKMVNVGEHMRATLEDLKRRDKQFDELQGDQLPPSDG